MSSFYLRFQKKLNIYNKKTLKKKAHFKICENYHLIAQNLANFDLNEIIEKCALDCKSPILIICECILLYLTASDQKNIFDQFSQNFCDNCYTFLFEPTDLTDNFGKNMIKSVKSKDEIDIRDEMYHDSEKGHIMRFENSNWATNKIYYSTLWQFFLEMSEKSAKRLLRIEKLDEHHLMKQLFDHYCFLLVGCSSGKILFDPHEIMNECAENIF